jgi:hypothetical protein
LNTATFDGHAVDALVIDAGAMPRARHGAVCAVGVGAVRPQSQVLARGANFVVAYPIDAAGAASGAISESGARVTRVGIAELALGEIGHIDATGKQQHKKNTRHGAPHGQIEQHPEGHPFSPSPPRQTSPTGEQPGIPRQVMFVQAVQYSSGSGSSGQSQRPHQPGSPSAVVHCVSCATHVSCTEEWVPKAISPSDAQPTSRIHHNTTVRISLPLTAVNHGQPKRPKLSLSRSADAVQARALLRVIAAPPIGQIVTFVTCGGVARGRIRVCDYHVGGAAADHHHEKQADKPHKITYRPPAGESLRLAARPLLFVRTSRIYYQRNQLRQSGNA